MQFLLSPYDLFLVTKNPDGNILATKRATGDKRVTGIAVHGNSQENQLNFFPLDLEISFSISRSRLETRD